MANKKRHATYHVTATVTVTIAIKMNALSLEQAAVAAKELKAIDFLKCHGEFLDESDFRITGVYE